MDTQAPETRTHEEPGKVWLTVPEAAEELRIPRSRCYELIQRGELPPSESGSGASGSTGRSWSGSFWSPGA